MTYVFEIDMELPGYIIMPNGTRYDQPVTGSYARRYAKLISAPALDVSSNIYNSRDDNSSSFYLDINSQLIGRTTTLIAGTKYNPFQLWQGNQLSIDQWYEGMEHVNFRQDTYVGTELVQFGAYNSLTLTSISPNNPLSSVPIPTTICLLGFGFLGLAGVSRSKR